MKTRIKFSKMGYIKFIGHLDVQRYFQQALKRADIPVLYSKGFSPHPLLSFASPLGIGMTSEGEYADLELDETLISSLSLCMDKLNRVMNEGISILDWKEIDAKTKNAMASVAAADYLISFRAGYYHREVFLKRCQEFFAQEEMRVLKKTKHSQREENIRPLLIELYPKEDKIFMKTLSGSANNLKPELVMLAFCNYLGLEYEKLGFQVHRLETYQQTDGEFIALL